jgi:mono/diheme cytochrome c family protein
MTRSRHLLPAALVGLAAAIVTGSGVAGQGQRNPLAATPEVIAAGKQSFDAYCAGCHGNRAQGAVKAGLDLSVIAEQGGKQPPDLTDAQWDHGSSDAEIFTVIKNGVPPTMMAGWGGSLSDTEIWSVVHYLRSLAANPNAAVDTTSAAAPKSARYEGSVQLDDFLQLPITGDIGGEATRGELARVNFMREEPGGRRFFITDLNGPLYIFDRQSKQLVTYLDFNGLGDRKGLFRRLTFERNFATGLIDVVFDPDYARNGVFYTIHMEDPTVEAPAEPRSGAVPGLDLTGYATTPTNVTPAVTGAPINREGVLIEWTDRNTHDAVFEGTARELLRMQLASPIHPLGDLTFNPAARPGDEDWRVMYVGVGDSGTGEQKDMRRRIPQRLDNLHGKILRIIPDLRTHTGTSRVSGNGRYRIPNDNPFVSVEGARPEIWAVGLRNPHRLIWDVDPARGAAPRLIAFSIGLTSWEGVFIIKKGANYGYPLREGPRAMTPQGMTPVPADDTIPWQITDTVTRGTTTPVYPVISYPHTQAGGDAIAGGVIVSDDRFPLLKDSLLFGDITTGRIWFARMSDVMKADDGVAETLAPMHELDAGLRALVLDTFHARGGQGATLPGSAAVAGRGRVDLRLAGDSAGNIYVITKSDGMIRRVAAVH